MKKRLKKRMATAMIAAMMIFSSTMSPSLAMEVSTVQTETTEEQEIQSVDMENQASANLEQPEVLTEDIDEVVQEEERKENSDEGLQGESKESISLQQDDSAEEIESEPEDLQEDINETNNQQDIINANIEIEKDEIAGEKTKVIRASDYTEYYQENVKLVEKYDTTIDSDSPYALKRILGKMNQEVNLENYGAAVLVIGPDNSFMLQFETEEMTERVFLELSQLEQLEYCELDAKMPEVEPVEETDQIARDPDNWNLEMLEIDQYIEYVKKKVGNESITVCVLDSGADATHPDLKDRMKYIYDEDGTPIGTYEDKGEGRSTGHGTHVSGIVAKCTKGLNVEILPLQGFPAWSMAATGVNLAVEVGAKVINMSFGTEYNGELVRYDCYETFHDAIQIALDAGVSIVTSAGNNGYTNLTIEDYYQCPSHFGVKDGVVTVANVDVNENRASDSGYGQAVDLAAPGTYIHSSYLNHINICMSGTSMAAPHITAIVAMMRLVNPEKSPAEIESLLKSYCKDLGEEGRDDYYGEGIPKMSRAIPKHVWSDEYTIDKAPSCTESGAKSIHCIDCNEIKQDSTRTIEALGHDMKETIVKATLKQAGSITQNCSRCSYSNKKTIDYPKTMELSKKTYQYTGSAKKPLVTMKDSKGNKIDASNYTVKYEGNRIQPGTYNVIVTFKGKYYTGTMKDSFTIQAIKEKQEISCTNYIKSIGDAAFKVRATLHKGNGKISYTSSDKNVATISSSGKVILKSVGETTITITASETAKYKKTVKKIMITVKPKQLKITRLKNPIAKTIETAWTKDSSVDGYVLQYARNINFTNPNTLYMRASEINTRKIGRLTKGKKYYVRVRSYKSVDGDKYFSKWSSIRYILIRK